MKPFYISWSCSTEPFFTFFRKLRLKRKLKKAIKKVKGRKNERNIG